MRAGLVHTLDPARAAGEPADTLLLHHGRVTAVGTWATLREQARGVPVVDLRDAVVTPGLTDAHIHLTEWALARREVDLADAATPEEAAALAAAAGAGEGGWVRGRGWNPHRWGGALPEPGVLDHAVGARPVVLQSHDMHALWVSRAGLERAGIHGGTPDPEGGRIVRDDAGVPTGVLLENAARMVTTVLPVPGRGAMADAVAEAQAALHALGITGAHSFPGLAVPEPDPLPVLTELRAEGRLRPAHSPASGRGPPRRGPGAGRAERPGRRRDPHRRRQALPGWRAGLAHGVDAHALRGRSGHRGTHVRGRGAACPRGAGGGRGHRRRGTCHRGCGGGAGAGRARGPRTARGGAAPPHRARAVLPPRAAGRTRGAAG